MKKSRRFRRSVRPAILSFWGTSCGLGKIRSPARPQKTSAKTIEQAATTLYNTSNVSCLTNEKEEVVMGPGISTKYAKRVLAVLVILVAVVIIAVLK
jgi:hypothetical protein